MGLVAESALPEVRAVQAVAEWDSGYLEVQHFATGERGFR